MMKTGSWIVVLALAPAVAAAQASGQAQASAAAGTQVQAGKASANARAEGRAQVSFDAPRGWTAEGAAKLSAMYADAREKDVPPEPIARRVAEGSAKGASETTILASAGKVKARLEASHQAMVQAGREHPSPEETERGAGLLERGVTEVQLEAMARKAPSDRSLVVAFDVLGRLAARGVPVTKALAQVQGKLEARASDGAILALAGTSTTSASAGAAGSMAGTASTTAAGTTKGLTAGVAGTVTGVVKKP